MPLLIFVDSVEGGFEMRLEGVRVQLFVDYFQLFRLCLIEKTL